MNVRTYKSLRNCRNCPRPTRHAIEWDIDRKVVTTECLECGQRRKLRIFR